MTIQPNFRDDLEERVKAALQEDFGVGGDVTSQAIFGQEAKASAGIWAKQSGVLSGAVLLETVFHLVDSSLDCELHQEDGNTVSKETKIFSVSGSTCAILAAERTALNFLQRMSGVATLTNEFVKAAGPDLAVCDTRKTTPIWRDLEKYAVLCGGGTNHRMRLDDMAMLKDTHADKAGSVAEALRRLRDANVTVPIAAEARNLEEVQACLDAKADLIMLDNMPLDTVREAISLIDGRTKTEVTGGVTLDTISQWASLGLDRVSVGALTHSAPSLDFSLRIDRTSK